MIWILFICIVLALGIRWINYLYWEDKFSKSIYATQTNNTLRETLNDPGRAGEAGIYFALQGFEDEGARFLFNLYIPKANGQTTEIDILMISRNGIFVYESKNYSGWIFGDERRRYWYQTLYAGRRRRAHKEPFYNPVMQNAGHIRHLKKILGQDIPIMSVIVFSDRCELKNIRLSSGTACVVHKSDVAFRTKYLMNQIGYETLSEEDIDRIYRLLYPYTQADDHVKEMHVRNIRRSRQPLFTGTAAGGNAASPAYNDSAICSHTACECKRDIVSAENTGAYSGESAGAQPENTDPLVCPLCGGKLILRTARGGKYAGGQFYGCSNFPKCRYIKNVNKDTPI